MQGELIKAEKYGNAAKITALLYDSPEVLDRIVSLSGQEVSITIAKPREKRSLDSNNYFWLLVRKIADRLGEHDIDKIYLKLLKDYGQSIVVTVSSKYDFSRARFKYYEVFKDGLINGKPFTAYKVFIGSSQYNREEMRKLIDGTIKECKELGIDVELEDIVPMMA